MATDYLGLYGPSMGGFFQQEDSNVAARSKRLQDQVVQQGILSKLKQEQEAKQAQQAVMGSQSAEEAIANLQKLGTGAAVGLADKLSQQVQRQQLISKQKNENKLSEQFSGMDLNNVTPEQVRAIGVKAGIGGHPGAATMISQADRMQQVNNNQVAMQGMRSAPAQAEIQMPPAELGGGPAQPAISAKPGVADYLLDSPHVGKYAAALQRQIDAGGAGMTPSQIESRLKGLETLHTTTQRSADMQAERIAATSARDANAQARRIEIKNMFPPTGRMGPNVSNGITPENAHLKGQEFLATLDPNVANNVKGLLDYSAPLSSFSTRVGDRAAMLAMAKQVDPSFDVQKYNLRYGLRQDFTKGKTSENIVALDQAVNHMGTLKVLGDALGNNDPKAINAAVNYVKDQLGNPNINNFDVAKQAVGTELMRVFRQVNASEVETKAWEDRFKASNSPEQIRGAIKIGAELLNGRLKAINQKWNRGMEADTGFPGLLSPEATKALQSFGVTPAGSAPARRPTDNASTSTPANATVERAVSKSGKPMHKENDKWVYD